MRSESDPLRLRRTNSLNRLTSPCTNGEAAPCSPPIAGSDHCESVSAGLVYRHELSSISLSRNCIVAPNFTNAGKRPSRVSQRQSLAPTYVCSVVLRVLKLNPFRL